MASQYGFFASSSNYPSLATLPMCASHCNHKHCNAGVTHNKEITMPTLCKGLLLCCKQGCISGHASHKDRGAGL